MKEIRLRLGSNSYDIDIGPGILKQSGHQLKEIGFDGRLVVISNPVVHDLYGDVVGRSLTASGFAVTTLTIPDGEEQKSLETAGRLYRELAECHAERTTPILALGGGVIGDLAGFVAATYLRGVPLVQLPTTLLAQVDSSIGGKVALDHDRLKNKIGAFYQPRLVISDIDTIRTLDDKQFTNGLAEVIKYGVIRDEGFFTYLENNLDKIKLLDAETVEEIVFRSAKIKAEVVEKDEKDLGLRAILNFGHTVGHAVESVSNFKVSHGEAVAIGMLAAARISQRMSILKQNELARLEDLIKRAGLPTRLPDPGMEKLVAAMKQDKKVLKGRLRFILPESLGKVFITEEVDLSLVEQALIG